MTSESKSPRFMGNKLPWLIIILIVGLGYWQNVRYNEKLADTQHQLIVQAAQANIQRDCTQQFLVNTVSILNERTASTPALNAADAAKVRSESQLFGFIVKVQGSTPPGEQASQATVDEFNRRTKAYFDSITRYLTVLGKTDINQTLNPFPTEKQYRTCLNQPVKGDPSQ